MISRSAEMWNRTGQKIALIETSLRTPGLSVADMAIEVSKIQSRADRAFELVATSTGDATLAFTDLSRTDAKGHTAYLKITTAARNDAVARLANIAGTSPADASLDDRRPPSRLPAVATWRWFQQGWLGSDIQ